MQLSRKPKIGRGHVNHWDSRQMAAAGCSALPLLTQQRCHPTMFADHWQHSHVLQSADAYHPPACWEMVWHSPHCMCGSSRLHWNSPVREK